jgi:hypothetical protein
MPASHFDVKPMTGRPKFIIYSTFEVGFVGKNTNNVIPLLVKSFLMILLTYSHDFIFRD